MGTIAPFPGCRAPAAPPPDERPAPLPATGGRHGEYGLADVARPLGLLQFGIRTIIAKLRLLAEKEGMPLPRTPRIVDGERLKGPASIYKNSRWDAAAIDAWLDGDGPAGPAAAPAPVSIPVRQTMAARAAAIGAGLKVAAA